MRPNSTEIRGHNKHADVILRMMLFFLQITVLILETKYKIVIAKIILYLQAVYAG